MNIPTEKEINIFNSLDEINACKHFLGKDLQQAEALFRKNSAYYQEDLMWMGPVAFSFYLQAAINYLKSEASAEDSHLIACLYNIVSFRKKDKDFFLAIDRVRQMIAYIIEDYDKFQVDEAIYGDLLSRYKELLHMLNSKSE